MQPHSASATADVHAPVNVSAHGAEVGCWMRRGIGEAIAVYYAKEGASLYLCARSESNLAEVSKQCKAHGATTVETFAVRYSLHLAYLRHDWHG